ncbi:MAG: hypothetical protein KDD64_00685 [Bdellovibrionales bacterium]|nr:hypothetical protein [Bdellovibrionales bacterium]
MTLNNTPAAQGGAHAKGDSLDEVSVPAITERTDILFAHSGPHAEIPSAHIIEVFEPKEPKKFGFLFEIVTNGEDVWLQTRHLPTNGIWGRYQVSGEGEFSDSFLLHPDSENRAQFSKKNGVLSLQIEHQNPLACGFLVPDNRGFDSIDLEFVPSTDGNPAYVAAKRYGYSRASALSLVVPAEATLETGSET